MTAAQTAAKAKFKKAIAYRQKTGVSLKEAFAHVYGKKVGAAPKKKAAKKAAPKKAAKKVVKKAAPKKAAKKVVKKATPKKVAPKKYKKCGIIKKHVRNNTKVKSHARKVAGVHKDTKSHNVNIRVVSGISKNDELKRLTQLAAGSPNKLVKKVATMLKSKVINGGYDSLRSVMNDVLRSGLQSGIISDLIYYSDTKAWFKKYKPEIMKLLREVMFNYGTNNPADIFGKNWDDEDPFAQDTNNQNLLAWFSFEEITRELADTLGYEI
jgi:hypothetical protein